MVYFTFGEDGQDLQDVADNVPPTFNNLGTDNGESGSISSGIPGANRNVDGRQSSFPEASDVEGAVGYSPDVRTMQTETYVGPFNHTSNSRRSHSSGELVRRRPYEGIERSQSDLFGPGERQSSSESSQSSSGFNYLNQLEPNHNHFATSYSYPPGISPETANIGSHLYARFLVEEIQNLNLQEPECLNPQYANPPPPRNNEIIIMADTLRHTANEFSHSEHRRRVQERAESVSLENLDFTTFSDLLNGLFQEGGVTSERVIVLFFFCSDLAIRALREKLLHMFHFITHWSQLYIVLRLCLWVQEQGGWAAVLDHSVSQIHRFAVIGLSCVGIMALVIYIRNNIRSN